MDEYPDTDSPCSILRLGSPFGFCDDMAPLPTPPGLAEAEAGQTVRRFPTLVYMLVAFIFLPFL
jgi:hypothetical protein